MLRSGHDLETRTATEISEGRAAVIFMDVQYDYFDFERLRNRGASEEACAKLPMVGKRIGRFALAVDAARKTHNIPLRSIWVVHAHNRQLKAISRSPAALRTEIVVDAPATDDIVVKHGFNALEDPQLGRTLAESGKRTLLLAGGIFEDCVMASALCAHRDYGMNVVLLPDLIAGRGGQSRGHITGNLPMLQNRQNQWFAALDSRVVLKAMRRGGTKPPIDRPAIGF